MEEEASNGKYEEVKKEQEVIKDDGDHKKIEVENESSKEIVIDGIPEKVTESQENSKSSSSSSDSSDEETELEKTNKDLPMMREKVLEPVVDVIEPANLAENELAENPVESNVHEGENEVKILNMTDKVNLNGVAVVERAIEESWEAEDPASAVVEKAAVAAVVKEAAEAKENEEMESVIQPKEESVNAGESSEPVIDLESKGTATTSEVGESVQTHQQVPETAACTTADETSTKKEIPETTENPPILSVTQRTYQPTSWKSCCGLFEVLRRSDR